jgi:hypothetical protein
LGTDHGLEHAKILVGGLTRDRGLVEVAEGIHDTLLVLARRSNTALCQQQVHRVTARILLCLYQTRPRVISTLGSNASAPAPPLSSSRRVLPCIPADRVDELAQNLDECHVRSSCNTSPSRNTHTTLCRRFVDRLLLLRRSFKVMTNNRGHTPHRGHSPCATQGLLRYSGPREEMLHTVSSNARATVRDSQESSPRRLRPPSAFAGAVISCLPALPLVRFHLTEVL